MGGCPVLKEDPVDIAVPKLRPATPDCLPEAIQNVLVCDSSDAEASGCEFMVNHTQSVNEDDQHAFGCKAVKADDTASWLV